MDARLSPEQLALRESARQVAVHLGPKTVADLDDGERRGKLDAAIAAVGWRELRAPSGDGCPWASGVEVAIVAEQLGQRLADVPFLGPTLAADLRRLAHAPASDIVETVLLDGHLTAACQAGAAGVALDAAEAEQALVLIPEGEGWTIGLVDLTGDRGGFDLTRAMLAVGTVEPRRVDGQDALIGTEGLDHWTALGLAAACADLVGVMRGAIELSVGYASQRRQFGKPIGSFQAVQHLLADAAVQAEGSWSTTLYAAWAVDALPPADALAAAASAKAYCARAARSVCETAIQVHGGIGNTWDCLAHLYLRRATLSSDVLGGVGTSLERVLELSGIGGSDGLR